MPDCFIRILTDDGLRSVDYHANSLADAALHEPADGIYTVTNTYNIYQTLKLDAHFERLQDSARRANIPLSLDRKRLRLSLRQMIDEAGYGDVRFRITIPCDAQPIIISLEPFTPPAAELIANGARCITAPNKARHDPTIKKTAWMHTRQQIIDSLPASIYDAILLDNDGNMLEGLGSNFYAIVDGELYTAGEGVLAGIARQIVLEVAPSLMTVRMQAVNIRDLKSISEAFITSSSRGIVPIVEIDGYTLGDGQPGPQTKNLRHAYNTWVNDHLEDL
jgi:branched-chain amino acid aminotransferase